MTLSIDPEKELFGDEKFSDDTGPLIATKRAVVEPTNVERIPQDVDIDSFVLDLIANAKQLRDVDIRSRISEALIQRTIEGASNVTVSVNDWDHKLRSSGALKVKIDTQIDQYWYRLQAINKSGDILELVFIDRDVAYLKQRKEIKKAVRGAKKKLMTRAEFCFMLVKLVRNGQIKVVCPELHKKQDQAKPKEQITKNRARDRGIAGNDFLIMHADHNTTKATKQQIRIMERILDQGSRMGASEKVLICSIMTPMIESGMANLRGGDRDSVGLYQQRGSQGWPASRDIEKDSRAFFQKAIALDKKDSNIGYGELCQSVQRSAFGYKYLWAKPAAQKVVNAYNGEGLGRTVKRVRRKFSTESDGKPQNWWDAIGRLMDEVGWRRFMSNGVIYLISEEDLFRSKPRYIFSADTDGIHNIDYQYDVGQPTSEVSVTCMVKKWQAPPGTVVQILNESPVSDNGGRWLVATIERSVYSPIATVTLKRPRPELPEPADDTRIEDTREYSTGTGLKRVDQVYRKMKHIHKEHYPYVWGGGHASAGHPSMGGYDCSGSVASALSAGGFYPEGEPVPRSDFLGNRYAPGRGRFITIFSNSGHVFIEIKRNGKWVHFGTGDWGKGWRGAGINTRLHPHSGFKMTHPKGF